MLNPRLRVIIEWPLKRLFNNARDMIITSWTDAREMEDNDNDNEPSLGTKIKRQD